ncbi:MAG TPA: SDR family oxidoreductase, partial [Gammaproteobacteria bacterium]|nr:SDR family oxidoreductase [Gammaproteobacteria bacterium]
MAIFSALHPEGQTIDVKLRPGSVNGPRIDNVIEKAAKEQSVDADRIRQTYRRQSSMRQYTDAEDVAAMALFLRSNAGAKISGQAIGIDG